MKSIDIATMKWTLPGISKGVKKYINIMAWVHIVVMFHKPLTFKGRLMDITE